jgi:hypothetical protein
MFAWGTGGLPTMFKPLDFELPNIFKPGQEMLMSQLRLKTGELEQEHVRRSHKLVTLW